MIEHKAVELPAGPEIKALPPAPPPKRRRGSTLLWLLLFAGIGFIVFRSYKASQEKKAAAQAAQEARLAHRAISVAAAAVHRGDLPIYLRGLGTVAAYNIVNVKSRVDGPLVSVNFKEGQMVRAGDVLAQIDPRTFQVVVEQTEGQLARDQAQLNDAKANQARYQKLWEEGVIARQQLDTQSAQVGQFEGSIAADQANINNAKLNLSFTKITAPIAGRIGLRQVDVGNIVHASDQNPLAVITQMQPITVLFTIPADSLQPVLAKLRAGATLPVDAYDRADRNKIATGKLLTVDNQIDPATGTSRLKAVFENTDSALFPNQFVNCRLLLETRRGVLLVPAPAVQRGPQGSYVYIVNPDHTAKMRNITIGVTEGNNVEVTAGLKDGETIVTDGQDKLQDGSNVDVRPDSGVRPAQGAPPQSPPSNRGPRTLTRPTEPPTADRQENSQPAPSVPRGSK
jgi:membrane fusion protein, multidrug efflux system